MFITLAFVTGLLIGWNFLKQPKIVEEWVQKVKARIFS
jgi:hypothetical protein